MTINEILHDKIINDFDSDFKIDKEIKCCEYYKIYVGTIKSTEQKVVIKEALSNNKISIDSILLEAKVLSCCKHPSIQLLIGLYQNPSKGEYKLITPYYENGSIRDVLFPNKSKDEHKIPNTKIFIIAYGIASAMEFLHYYNIAHSDLKLSKIVLNDSIYPILINFGISKRSINEMTTVNGTRNYQAPEVYLKDVFTEKVDVYSFGMILLEIYSSKMIEAKEKMEIPIDKNMPYYLHKLVKKCLNSDPIKRPSFNNILSYLDHHLIDLENPILARRYLDFLQIYRRQKIFFRIPKQIFYLEGNKKLSLNIKNLNCAMQLENNAKVILVMLIGPIGNGKSAYLRYLTGNQAFISGHSAKSKTKGIFIDGPYSIDDIQNQIPMNFIIELKIDKNYKIFFLDSQGLGDEFYDENKEILDRINSIFCSVSSVCISIQSVSDDVHTKEVFQIARGIQFTGPTKHFILLKDLSAFNTINSLTLNALTNFQGSYMKKYKESKKSVMEYYDFNNVTPMPFGDMNDMNGLYRSIWFSFQTILSNITEDMVYTKDQIKINLNSRFNIFFGNIYESYYDFITRPPSEIASILQNPIWSEYKINNLCITTFYWSLDIIFNYLHNSFDNVEEINDNILMFINYTVKFFYSFMLSHCDCTYRNFLQFIMEMKKDLISYAEVELEKKLYQKKYTFTGLLISAGEFLVSLFKKNRSNIITQNAEMISSMMMCCTENRKIDINEIKRTIKYSNYPLIWNKTSNQITMINLPFSRRYLIENDNFDNLCGNDDDLDHFLLTEKMNNQDSSKELAPKIQKIKKELSNSLNNYQLIIFFEQNDENNSSLLFRALSGIDVNFEFKKQVKISSDAIKVDSLMLRFKNGHEPISSMSNKNVKFIYMKGYAQNALDELYDYCQIKPIFVSSLKEGNGNLQIFPKVGSDFHLFYFSQNLYQLMADENYNGTSKWDFVVNENSINSIFDNSKITQLKIRLGIPFAKIIPVNSNDDHLENSDSIAQALIKYGCLSILQGKFPYQAHLG